MLWFTILLMLGFRAKIFLHHNLHQTVCFPLLLNLFPLKQENKKRKRTKYDHYWLCLEIYTGKRDIEFIHSQTQVKEIQFTNISTYWVGWSHFLITKDKMRNSLIQRLNKIQHCSKDDIASWMAIISVKIYEWVKEPQTKNSSNGNSFQLDKITQKNWQYSSLMKPD